MSAGLIIGIYIAVCLILLFILGRRDIDDPWAVFGALFWLPMLLVTIVIAPFWLAYRGGKRFRKGGEE
jgi:signal transduction histidine kinase